MEKFTKSSFTEGSRNSYDPRWFSLFCLVILCAVSFVFYGDLVVRPNTTTPLVVQESSPKVELAITSTTDESSTSLIEYGLTTGNQQLQTLIQIPRPLILLCLRAAPQKHSVSTVSSQPLHQAISRSVTIAP